MAFIHVYPENVLSDVPVSICIVKLKPNQRVIVRSKLVDEFGSLFECEALYESDNNGDVFLDKDPSLGGSYTGVEPMGLFWGLKGSPRNKMKFCRLSKRDVRTPYNIEISVHASGSHDTESKSSEAITSTVVVRWFMNDSIERIPVRDGRLRGTMFVPRGNGPYPTVLDLFGLSGGLFEARAALLATKGFITLSLAYFKYEDLPQELVSIEMEYFEEAKEFLLRHPKAEKQGIGVIGSCAGGTIALLMASCMSGITCVVNINGPVFVQFAGATYKGKQWDPILWDSSCLVVKNDIVIIRNALPIPDTLLDLGSSRIHFDKCSTSFLFLFSGDDCSIRQNLNMSLAIEAFKESNNTNYVISFYLGAGHFLEPPYSPLTRIIFYEKRNILWGGKPKEHAVAQEKSWKEMINFLKRKFDFVSNL